MNIQELESGGIQYRSAEVKDIDGHEMLVRAVPYSEQFTDIGGGIEERFLQGAFAKAASAPHRLAVFHDHGGPLVGRGIGFEDKPDGPYIRAKVGRTEAAMEMLSLLEDQILTDVSVEFRALPDYLKVERAGDKMQVTHRRAHLNGFAVVPEGAYAEKALVLSARDAQRDRQVEAAKAWFQSWRKGA